MTDAELEEQFEQLLFNREWRLDNLYSIVNEDGVKIPFVRNEAQRQLWAQLWYWSLILKARQHGISTFIVLLMLDTCLFNKNTHCGLIDRTETEATKKLDKVKFAYANLAEPERAYLHRLVPLVKANETSMEWKNGSRIDVGTSHRGGTLQILHVSEMGPIAAIQPRRAKEIRTGAFGTVHRGSLAFIESTAAGAHGDFFELFDDAHAAQKANKELAQTELKLVFLPWHTHPSYREDPSKIVIPKELAEYFGDLEANHGIKLDAEQRAWYALTRKKMGPDKIWSEYPSYAEEAFKISVEGAYFKVQMTKGREERRIGVVPLDPSRPVNTFWDIGKDDNTAVWFHQNHGQLHHFVDYYENSGEGVEHYARYLDELKSQRKFTYGKHYGPHDLDHSHWILPGAQTVQEVARGLGIDFIVVPRIANKTDAIEAGRNMLARSWIDEEHCTEGIRCLDNYRKKWDENRGHYMSEPLHDWASHGADAYMTGACGFAPAYIPPPEDRYTKPRSRSSAWAA